MARLNRICCSASVAVLAIGFSLSTAVAEAMSLYVRYEGNIAGQDSSHALTAGLRMSW